MIEYVVESGYEYGDPEETEWDSISYHNILSEALKELEKLRKDEMWKHISFRIKKVEILSD